MACESGMSAKLLRHYLTPIGRIYQDCLTDDSMKISEIKSALASRMGRTKAVQSFVNKQILRSLPHMCEISESSESDVFVVGYPKSGNTWMQHLVASLAYGIRGAGDIGRAVQALVPDVHHARYYQRFGEVTYFKVSTQLTPSDKAEKYGIDTAG